MANVFKKQMMKATCSMYTDVSDKLKPTKNTAVAGSSLVTITTLVPKVGAWEASLFYKKRGSFIYTIMGSSVLFWDFQVTPVVRTHLPMQEAYETHVRSLSREDPLEEGMATHSSILAWRIPMDRGAGRLQSMRLHRVGHDCSDLARSTVLFLLYLFFSSASSSPPSSADIQNP